MTTKARYLLLTGAAGGIGRELRLFLQAEGWTVISTDRPGSIPSSPATGNWIPLDLEAAVQKPDKLQPFLKNITKITNESPLAAIVHNAALQIVAPFQQIDLQEWQRTFSVNLMAPVLLNRVFLSQLIESNGSILNISSIHSQLTKPGFTAYAASKAALSGLTQAMAVELGHLIRVNAIEPAAISTAMLEAGFSANPKDRDQLDMFHPCGHIGCAADVARAASYLLDPRNTFLNGCVLKLGGGIHNRLHDPI